MLFFNSYRSPTIAGDTTPNPLLPFSSSLFLLLSLRHPNLHQQWQRRLNEWRHCKMKNLKEELDPSCPEACAAILWKSSQAAPKAAKKLKITAQEHYRVRIANVENLNGSSLNDDKVLFVGKAQRKAEREAELKAKFEQERNSRFEKLQGANLYLKNLDDIVTDEKLKELFSEFGTITSCKIMLDPQGVSKRSGFVAFSTSVEATRALNAMNGKMIGQKPLYVVVAQRKDERRAQLQV
ncbi:Polyadenylate-binding protein 3 [Camellia lanceoleosa]|uniref:Polyadenylate-binding protein 3 n=1 Tax=Camellia lanceoleosa TaxID=1840588 RepID=A0ACC0GCF6_9ERIC|nr:Polyadenylate-binding protein 3 [Camellia lanceoleosa]